MQLDAMELARTWRELVSLEALAGIDGLLKSVAPDFGVFGSDAETWEGGGLGM